MVTWSPGDLLVVLGAGATRGAQFVEQQPLCLPPLNADFFTQLQRVQSAKHRGNINSVLRDVQAIYGSNYSITLEQYVTQLESLIQIARLATVKSIAYPEVRLVGMRDRLLVALSAVLEESADVAKSSSIAHLDPCGYHKAIVDVLRPRDTVISFNYDCVIDHSLRTHGTGKWSAKYGYCFPNPARVIGHEAWDADEAPESYNASVNLLKLHGSLNWRPLPAGDGEEIKLRERTYKQGGDKDYELVPPESRKHIEDRVVLKRLWGSAERAIRTSRTLVFIGFSFTPTDLHVDSLFRMALGKNKNLAEIVIVNPSAEHRRAIRAVCRTQLDRGIRLTQFDYLSEFAPHAAAVVRQP
jgi:hypothetical protein